MDGGLGLMRGPEVIAFEKRLKELFDTLDLELEKRWGASYQLHPSRSSEGTTANPEDDGLFNIGAGFSAGYGSETGRGYVIEVRMSTLETVPETVRNTILAYVSTRVDELLEIYFPDKELNVVKDGGLYKIVGDLGLA